MYSGGLTHLLQAQSSHLFLPPEWHGAQLVKKVGFFKKIDDFVRRCIRKKFFDSFSGEISISDIIKFCGSNEKMLNGERFITGYTKRMDGWMFELFIDAQPQ